MSFVNRNTGHKLIYSGDGVVAVEIDGGHLDLSNNKLVNLGTPTAASDAATKGYADSLSSGTNTGDQSLFSTIAVSGQSNVVADSSSDTLTLVAGTNITITTDAGADSITIAAAGSGLSDGDKGDITVSSSGTVWTIDAGVVTFAKMQAVSANVLLGNDASGTAVEEITCTAAGRALLDDAAASDQRTTLGLGTLATQSGTFSGTSSGTNTGDQTITLTGQVTGSGTGSFATTIVTAQPDAHTWAATQTFTLAPVFTDASGSRTALGLGTAAVKNTGTSGNTVPLLDGTNSWSGAQTFLNSSGIKILDTNASHSLGLIVGSNITADRTLTITTGDADRVLTFTADATVGGTSSGTNTGDQTITLTGQVTGSGTSSFATIIATAQPDAHTWAATQTFTLAPVFTDASGSRTALGLGTAAVKNTGTSGNTVPLLDGVNSWSGAQTFLNSSGIKILDTNASHSLGLIVGSNITADRTLTITTGDADRILTFTADASIGGTISGTNTGDQTITLTGQVTGSGTSSFATIIATAQPDAHTWAAAQTFTLAPVFTDASGTRTALGLGTSAVVNTGTSGTTVPLLDGTNSWSGAQTFLNSSGIKILDTNASHSLGLIVGSNITADRTLTITTGDASRVLTFTADASIGGTISGTNTGDQTITLTGDVTGSGTGSFATTIANDAVTYAKMQNVSATDKLLGRSTAGAGDVEEITCTAAGRALLDDAAASNQRTTLGLGTSAVINTGTSGTTIPLLDGVNSWSGAQTFLNSSGIKILDTNASHSLGLIVGSDLTANRTLTVTTGDADRTLIFTGATSTSGTNTGDQTRNPIDNANFNVWQRGTSFTSVADNQFTADRWNYRKVGAVVHTITQDTSVPTVAQGSACLSNYSMKLAVTTADTSIAATDNCVIQHIIEGYDWLPFAQLPFTLSFWMKSSTTGTYCVNFGNSGDNRSFIAEYTCSSANTWQYVSIPVLASPSAGTWNYTNGIGLIINFVLSAGSNFQSTAGSWLSSSAIATSNQVNNTGTNGNTFFLSQVQITSGYNSVGAGSTDKLMLQPLSMEEDLAKCQRYYETSYDYGTVPGTSFTAGANIVSVIGATATYWGYQTEFAVTKRSAPTTFQYWDHSGNASKATLFVSGAWTANQTTSGTSSTTKTCYVQCNVAAITGINFAYAVSSDLF